MALTSKTVFYGLSREEKTVWSVARLKNSDFEFFLTSSQE